LILIGMERMRNKSRYALGLLFLCLIAVFAQSAWQYKFVSAGNFPGAIYSVPLGLSVSKTVGYYVSLTKNDAYVQTGAKFVDAAPAGSCTSYLSGINEDGIAVGGYCSITGGCNPEVGERGYAYDSRNGKIITIMFPLAGAATTAYGINGRRVIVGGYCPNNNVCPSGLFNPASHGFVYENGSYTTLDFPGAQATSAFAINDAGTVVGYYLINNTGPHAFLYKNGTFSTIDFPGSGYTVATSINSIGAVAGLFSGSTGVHGFIYYGGNFTQIDKPGAIATGISAINDHNDLVGIWYPTYGFKNFKAFPVASTAGSIPLEP
jgi:probable HAF family extracellular repeat protein